MMPQSQNADYSNGSSNNAVGIALGPQNGQYVSNNPMSGQISILNSSVQNQNLMAAALHLNQSNQGYINPGLATIGYIYPNNNSFVQASNLVFNPNNILHPPIEMIPSVSSSLGHIGNSSIQHNHKWSGYDNIQHFGSLSQNSSRKPKNSVMSKTNLYINGLQECDTDETVRALVEGIIDPKSCKAMMSHGKCRGSGFIDCANETDAEKVIHILRNRQMPGGTRLAVKFAYENEKDDLNVYVRNLPRTSNFNNNNLEDMFREFGQVVSVKLLQSDNQYTGTGFVRFSAAEEAQKAVDHMNVKKLMLTDDDKPVICKLADKGGRRMNHSLMNCGDSVHPQSQSLEGSDNMVNGSMPQISPEITDKNGYGMPIISGHQYSPQGLPWFNGPNQDLLVQEMQSLNLAQNAGYLLSSLMPGHLTMPYNDDTSIQQQQHQQQQQQQQLLAQFLWSHHPHNPQRIAAQYHHPSQVAQPQQHHHQQQQQVAQQQAQPMLQWPPIHHHQHNNTSNYYTPDHSYQSMIYPSPQYRHSRPQVPVVAGGSTVAVATSNINSQAIINNNNNSTLKSPSLDPSTIIGQNSSNQPILMNSSSNNSGNSDQQH